MHDQKLIIANTLTYQVGILVLLDVLKRAPSPLDIFCSKMPRWNQDVSVKAADVLSRILEVEGAFMFRPHHARP